MVGTDSTRGPMDTKPDAELVTFTRNGNTTAYAALWRRYADAGRATALSFTHSFDPDDLVAEPYTKVLEQILAGRGPTTAFRAYLMRIIQNIAVSWSRQNQPLPLGLLDDLAAPTTVESSMDEAVDHEILARAFATLPKRWRRVLWLTEIDGRKPRELAEELDMTPNAVAALATRAREGLRQAWISAHLQAPSGTGPEHQWTISRLGQFVRGKPTPRERARLLTHLHDCDTCSAAATEARLVAGMLGSPAEILTVQVQRARLRADITARDVETMLERGGRTPAYDLSSIVTGANFAGKLSSTTVRRPGPRPEERS